MTLATVYSSYGEKLNVSTFATFTDRNDGVCVLIQIEGATIHVSKLEELDVLAALISGAREKFMAKLMMKDHADALALESKDEQ